MTDRELLEAAAKAVGLENHVWSEQGYGMVNYFGGAPAWNPLRDDGDALRLAVKLKLRINVAETYTDVVYYNAVGAASLSEGHEGDPYAATRRAIVRAAASL